MNRLNEKRRLRRERRKKRALKTHSTLGVYDWVILIFIASFTLIFLRLLFIYLVTMPNKESYDYSPIFQQLKLVVIGFAVYWAIVTLTRWRASPTPKFSIVWHAMIFIGLGLLYYGFDYAGMSLFKTGLR